MERHDISSPPPPALLHRAMIVYHDFLLQRRRNPRLDFLAFWYKEARAQQTVEREEEDVRVASAEAEILAGIERLRDKAVEGSRNGRISLVAVRLIVAQIRAGCEFPDAKEYWDAVHGSLSQQAGTEMEISELSEAVVGFLKSLAEPSSASSMQPDVQEELDSLRRFVNTSIEAVRSEMKRESIKLRKELDSATTTAATSPVVAPSLPLPSRRAQELITGTRDPRSEWCASCAEWDTCLQQ
jgi:hypothetical protein